MILRHVQYLSLMRVQFTVDVCFHCDSVIEQILKVKTKQVIPSLASIPQTVTDVFR